MVVRHTETRYAVKGCGKFVKNFDKLGEVRRLLDVVGGPVRELSWRDGAHGGEFSGGDAAEFCSESSGFESVAQGDDFGFVCVVEFFDTVEAPTVFVVSAVFEVRHGHVGFLFSCWHHIRV